MPTSARAILHHTDQNGQNILKGSVCTLINEQSTKVIFYFAFTHVCIQFFDLNRPKLYKYVLCMYTRSKNGKSFILPVYLGYAQLTNNLTSVNSLLMFQVSSIFLEQNQMYMTFLWAWFNLKLIFFSRQIYKKFMRCLL